MTFHLDLSPAKMPWQLPVASWCPAVIRLRSEGKLVRAEGLEPSRTLRSNGFSYLLRLSPSLLFCGRVWGLDYPFTVPGFGSGCQVLPV